MRGKGWNVRMEGSHWEPLKVGWGKGTPENTVNIILAETLTASPRVRNESSRISTLPLLFNITVDSLARAIRHRKGIKST
jgi:hypothetical protein